MSGESILTEYISADWIADGAKVLAERLAERAEQENLRGYVRAAEIDKLDNLFAYVDRLLAGERDAGYTVGIFAAHHDAVSHKLRRLKDVLMRYCPPGNADLLNSVLFDIINCEDDLECHCRVEDNILVPVVARVESSIVPTACSQPGKTVDSDSPEAVIRLGRREREIITAVAKGWSNKEIADRLCISVHTVATHRRNICAKLAIHSSAGLTVYAILNGLVDLKDIDL